MHDEFRPTFTESRHEHWVIEALQPLFDEHWISDILYRVKPGKDATVFCCAAHPSTGCERLAAKVYRPRTLRTMKNDALYRQGGDVLDADGKAVRDSRRWRAMRKKTDFGRRLESTAWIQNEYQTLRALHAAGADVPRVLCRAGSSVLMEYLGDATRAAPTLHEQHLTPEEARPALDRLLATVELFLAHDRVHGDLSAYNVLCWDGRYMVIDVPQAVSAHAHPCARLLLDRDLDRLCRYFGRCGVAADPRALAESLWARYVGAGPTAEPLSPDALLELPPDDDEDDDMEEEDA